ncbi:MAG: hypothetical protein M0Z83_06955 [Betaproteobacteria bacterium]|nr:hypothetical protein [Betaproteobacteria bacterium]
MSLDEFIAYLSLIVSATALWRVREVKQLDLRIELQKSFNDLDVVLSGIENYLDFVYESHLRVMAAIGQIGSGAEKFFKADFSTDKEKLQELLNLQPNRKDEYKRSSQDELEREIVSIHSYRNQIAGLRAKYQKIFDADEDRRKEIRMQHQR